MKINKTKIGEIKYGTGQKLNIIKLTNPKKELDRAIDQHIISSNYKPVRDSKGRFTKRINLDTLGYVLTCCGISSLLTYVVILWL